MADSEEPLDIRELFEALQRHEVDYLVIGGVAVQVHGHRRTTKDLDVMPAPGAENAAKLAAALADVQARPADQEGGEAPSEDQLSVAAIVPPLTTIHGELHVLFEPKGAVAWDEMRDRALVVELGDAKIAISSLDDLIRMKLASGRPEDLDDVSVLTDVNRGR